MTRIFFKGLNEIRAIAALMVVFFHIEVYKARDGHQSIFDLGVLNDFFSGLGEHGVHIFFVLSGFLITYLLLTEKKERKRIDLKKFYIRRILRIWPLYYFIVFLSFFVVPFMAKNIVGFEGETQFYNRILLLEEFPGLTLLLFLLFLPNLALTLRHPVAGAAQTWSVGVEEQFYIIWPQIIQRISKRYLHYAFLLIVLMPLWVELAEYMSPLMGKIGKKIVGLLPIHLMAIGGLAAYLLFFYRKSIDSFLKSKFFFAATVFLMITVLFVPVPQIVFGVVVASQILFVIQDNFKLNLRNIVLNRIGEVSYGVYMYHPIVMFICFTVIHNRIGDRGVVYHLATHITIVLGTLGVSQLSYKYFEKPFINYKNRKFTIIKSGSVEKRDELPSDSSIDAKSQEST